MLSNDVFEDPRKRRDRLYIMAEILEVTLDGVLKTQVMYKANLSFAQLNEYLKLLLDLKLIEAYNSDEKKFYKTTPKGLRYLQSYREIRELLKKEKEHSPKNSNPNLFLVKRGSQVICNKGPF